MVKNSVILNKFYQRLMKEEKLPYRKAVEIFEALRKEAVSLGVFTSRNILDGIEIDIKIAKALNSIP